MQTRTHTHTHTPVADIETESFLAGVTVVAAIVAAGDDGIGDQDGVVVPSTYGSHSCRGCSHYAGRWAAPSLNNL